MVIITKVFVINENVYDSLILLVCGYLLLCNMQELNHYKKMVSMSHFFEIALVMSCPTDWILQHSTAPLRNALYSRMPDSQSIEHGFESLLLPFRILIIFILSMTPSSLIPFYLLQWGLLVGFLSLP